VQKSIKAFFLRFLRISLIFTLIFVVFAGGLVFYINGTLPSVEQLKDMHLEVPLRIMSSDGLMLAEYGDKQRIPVRLNNIPKDLIHAVLSVEDARYYQHSGVDFIGLLRAAKAVILSGRKVQGASTITMQVARNFFLSRKKTYFRKLREIVLAMKIDHELSKGKVLELYLNKVYFGHRAYGVGAAAQLYYGKPLNKLTLPQMAMIAGLPQSPSRNNPLTLPRVALERRNHVLKRMLKVGFINRAHYEKAIQAPITAHFHHREIEVRAPYVAEMVRQVLERKYGKNIYTQGWTVTTTIDAHLQKVARQALESGLLDFSRRHGYVGAIENWGEWSDENAALWRTRLKAISKHNLIVPAAVISVDPTRAMFLLADGRHVAVSWNSLKWARLRIPLIGGGNSTKDVSLGAWPKQPSDVVKTGDVAWLQHQSSVWVLAQVPRVQGAIVSVDPQTGGVIALSGGYDYSLSKFNRAAQSERQPGSSFKPFIYSAALAKGFTLASVINDAPVVLQDSGENQLWRPRNDTLKFYGPTRLRVGLEKSRNLVSVRLLRDITIPYAVDYLRRFGFGDINLPHSLSLALGSVSLSPLKLASGYAVFANGGFKVETHLIKKIVNQKGTVVFKDEFPRACDNQCLQTVGRSAPRVVASQVVASDNAYLMTQAMRGVIEHGTGRAAKVLHRSDLAGKTGTTNDQQDAWFSGFDRRILSVVWVGYDDLGSLHEYGSKAALPIWIDYMREALRHEPQVTQKMPPNIVLARIDPKTGLLASPNQGSTFFEYFRRQYVPQHHELSGGDSANPYDMS
jgi:penicillin-binding protein 1A